VRENPLRQNQNPAHFSTTLHLDIDMPFLV
jgi:hypothetical protein